MLLFSLSCLFSKRSLKVRCKGHQWRTFEGRWCKILQAGCHSCYPTSSAKAVKENLNVSAAKRNSELLQLATVAVTCFIQHAYKVHSTCIISSSILYTTLIQQQSCNSTAQICTGKFWHNHKLTNNTFQHFSCCLDQHLHIPSLLQSSAHTCTKAHTTQQQRKYIQYKIILWKYTYKHIHKHTSL